MSDDQDFYVGYQKKASPRLASWVCRSVVVILIVVGTAAWVLASRQSGFAQSKFEFLNYRDFEGVVILDPYPRLLVERPGSFDGHSQYSSYPVVAPFKFGADKYLSEWAGQKVRLQGALIYRDGQTMMELLPDSVEAVSVHTPHGIAEQGVSLGTVTMTGEIVDSKCFMGVMKPGNLKPHRACAIRCISGGIPPVFVVKARGGAAKYFLLVSHEGKAVNKDVLDKVATPVEISGEILKHGDQLMLKANPAEYRLL